MLIGEGAEAKIFTEKILNSSVVIKQRAPKSYRIKELDEALRESRTRKEAKIMLKASYAGVPVPRPIAASKYSIYMERLNGKLLKDTEQNVKACAKAGELLGRLHNTDIVHGDFTTANLLLSRKGLYVIDFGLSDFKSDAEEKAIDLLLIKRSLSKKNYDAFVAAYLRSYAQALPIIKKLGEVEKRGRYQTRTLQ